MKNRLFFCSLLLLLKTVSFAQPSEFNQAWLDTTKAIIIDPYYGNTIEWDKLIIDKRVVGIIHKASQGLVADTSYVDRKIKAKQYGLLWGSYHLGVPGDPIKQADFYLSLTNNDPDELLAIDIESTDSTKFITLKNAEIFIKRIKEKTGRYPLVYCNNQVLKEINKNYSSESIFAKCGLWYARFRMDIPEFEKNIWETYSLWQFSSEINCSKKGQCLYNIPGTDNYMDVNVYNGTKIELGEKWPTISK